MAPDPQRELVIVPSEAFEVVAEITLCEKVTHHVGHRVAIAELHRRTFSRPACPDGAVLQTEDDAAPHRIASHGHCRSICKRERRDRCLSAANVLAAGCQRYENLTRSASKHKLAFLLSGTFGMQKAGRTATSR